MFIVYRINDVNTYIDGDDARSFDEGAADVKEVSESGGREVTGGHTRFTRDTEGCEALEL